MPENDCTSPLYIIIRKPQRRPLVVFFFTCTSSFEPREQNYGTIYDSQQRHWHDTHKKREESNTDSDWPKKNKINNKKKPLAVKHDQAALQINNMQSMITFCKHLKHNYKLSLCGCRFIEVNTNKTPGALQIAYLCIKHLIVCTRSAYPQRIT